MAPRSLLTPGEPLPRMGLHWGEPPKKPPGSPPTPDELLTQVNSLISRKLHHPPDLLPSRQPPSVSSPHLTPSHILPHPAAFHPWQIQAFFLLRMKRASSLNFLNKSVEEPVQVWLRGCGGTGQ